MFWLGTKVKLTNMQLPKYSFPPFLKLGVPVSGNFTWLPWLLKYNGKWLSHFIHQFLQDPQMHLIRCHGLGHLQVPWMVSNLFFSYSFPHFSRFCLFILWLERCGWSTCWSRQRQKSHRMKAFSISWVTRYPDPFWREPTFPLVFLLLLMYSFSCFLWCPCPNLVLSGLCLS